MKVIERQEKFLMKVKRLEFVAGPLLRTMINKGVVQASV
ncbi:hypothetical protein DSBG_1980 [Desulfosporosinus sp. BG]|nr:hypothetical protein DSBG_1980 [Desulfosporosinus sp. BG]